MTSKRKIVFTTLRQFGCKVGSFTTSICSTDKNVASYFDSDTDFEYLFASSYHNGRKFPCKIF